MVLGLLRRCVSIGGGGGAVTLRQSRLLQSVEHYDAAVLTDTTVDAASATATCVSSVVVWSTVYRLP